MGLAQNSGMPRKPPVVFPLERRLLAELGQRLRLARLRRRLSTAVVAGRAGISRSSVYKVEAGDPGATMGTYLRVMATLSLEGDINALAADDRIGRKLQDLGLELPAAAHRPPRRTKIAAPSAAPKSGTESGS